MVKEWMTVWVHGPFRACCTNGSRIQEHQPSYEFLIIFLEICTLFSFANILFKILEEYAIERMGRLETWEEPILQLKSKSQPLAEFPLAWRSACCSIQAFYWLDEAHLCHVPHLKSTDLKSNPKNTFTETFRVTFHQMSRRHGPAKLTHKVKHHTW